MWDCSYGILWQLWQPTKAMAGRLPPSVHTPSFICCNSPFLHGLTCDMAFQVLGILRKVFFDSWFLITATLIEPLFSVSGERGSEQSSHQRLSLWLAYQPNTRILEFQPNTRISPCKNETRCSRFLVFSMRQTNGIKLHLALDTFAGGSLCRLSDLADFPLWYFWC